MSKQDTKAKPLTEEEYLQNLHSSAEMLEQNLARTLVKIHNIEDANVCESCHTPVKGPKGGTCPACMGPTIKPPKGED